MRLLASAFTAVLSGCCTYISREDAIQIAKGELGRRNRRLPHRYTVKATRSTIITESGPDIPVYVVSFNIPEEVSRLRFTMLIWIRVTVACERSVIFGRVVYSGLVRET